MRVDRLDHLVLTVKSKKAACEFYAEVLGMDIVTFGEGGRALLFGSQKINLHEQGREIEPKAHRPTPGSADLCFISNVPMTEIVQHLRSCGVTVLKGPVQRTGATGPVVSVYFRDPDLNLIEVSTYDSV